MSELTRLSAAVTMLATTSTAVSHPASGSRAAISAALSTLDGVPEASGALESLRAAQRTWASVEGSTAAAAAAATAYARSLG